MFTKIVVTAALLAAGAAHAVVVPGLYNTGVGPGGAPLAAGDGATDGNYVVRAGSPIPGVGAGPASTYFNTAYAAESATSRWISYSGSPFNGSGSFEIETSFDLTGYKASTARITGFWGVDNLGSVLLNRNVTGNLLTGANTSNFTVLHSFTIASGFTAGINTLSILGFDTGSPAAVRFDGLVLTADRAVPEPATWAMMVVGFGLVGAAVRRRSLESLAA